MGKGAVTEPLEKSLELSKTSKTEQPHVPTIRLLDTLSENNVCVLKKQSACLLFVIIITVKKWELKYPLMVKRNKNV